MPAYQKEEMNSCLCDIGSNTNSQAPPEYPGQYSQVFWGGARLRLPMSSTCLCEGSPHSSFMPRITWPTFSLLWELIELLGGWGIFVQIAWELPGFSLLQELRNDKGSQLPSEAQTQGDAPLGASRAQGRARLKTTKALPETCRD